MSSDHTELQWTATKTTGASDPASWDSVIESIVDSEDYRNKAAVFNAIAVCDAQRTHENGGEPEGLEDYFHTNFVLHSTPKPEKLAPEHQKVIHAIYMDIQGGSCEMSSDQKSNSYRIEIHHQDGRISVNRFDAPDDATALARLLPSAKEI